MKMKMMMMMMMMMMVMVMVMVTVIVMVILVVKQLEESVTGPSGPGPLQRVIHGQQPAGRSQPGSVRS